MTTQLSGTLTSATTSSSVTLPRGEFNIALSGGVATVAIQNNAVDGTTFNTVSQDTSGTAASYSLNGNAVVVIANNIESGVSWRISVTSYTSGTVTYRFGYAG
jgi:hypothetical protein